MMYDDGLTWRQKVFCKTKSKETKTQPNNRDVDEENEVEKNKARWFLPRFGTPYLR